jgi:hypothetical protein
MMHLLIYHTWILWRQKLHILFVNRTIQMEVHLIGRPNIAERYLIILSPFSKCCHSLMFVLNCKFRQHCRFVWMQIQITFNIRCTARLDIPSCAAASPVEVLERLCSATLTASMFSGERTDEGRRRFLSNTEPSLLN